MEEPTKPEVPAPRSSLRRKFIRTMLLVSSIIGGVTLAIVLMLSAQASERNLREIEKNIEEGITSKGKVLTENHALALRGMIMDNAFLDMQTVLTRAVGEDPDLVYGLFVNSDDETLAFRQRGAGDADLGPPAKDGWKALGLRKDELIVHRESVRRVERLGQEIVEVAVPVEGDEHEVLGTLRYGLSTRRMHQAIVEADTESRSQRLRSLELIGATVSLATLLGIALSRVQAVRITRPIHALTQAATELATGNRKVRVTINSGDELEVLGYSFNHMVEELSISYTNLEEMNRTLEQKVADRTAALSARNRDMRLVLDNVDQGFVTVSLDGAMASGHSTVVDQWFGAPGDAPTVWGYLARTSPSFALEFELAFEQLVADVLPPEVTLEQMPRRLCVAGSTFSFRYLPLLRAERLEGLLIVIADITDKLLREREDAELGEVMQCFRRLMLDRAGFTAFIAEASEMVREICGQAKPEAPQALKRMLHTLKGNAAQIGLTVMARLCHVLEDELAASEAMRPESLAELANRWQAITTHINELIGPVAQSNLHVSEKDYSALVSLLSSSAQTRALDQVLSWQLEPSDTALGRLAEQARSLAKRLGKGGLEVSIEPSQLRFDLEVFGPLFSDLGHVVRNAVDHGIEDPDEREAKGKSRAGHLAFSAVARGDRLIFEIADDGRGIDWDAIRAQGAALGLPECNGVDLVDILCHHGVTTRGDVTETSGRGVGMSAVKARIEAMHGSLEVESSPGSGTKWTIALPWSPGRIMERLRSEVPRSTAPQAPAAE